MTESATFAQTRSQPPSNMSLEIPITQSQPQLPQPTTAPSTKSMNGADVVLVLDESGSMSAQRQQVVDSVNEFITDQMSFNSPEGQVHHTTLTLIKFSDVVHQVYFRK